MRWPATLVLAGAAALAGCSGSGDAGTWGGQISQVDVRVRDGGCEVDPRAFPAGGVAFEVSNEGTADASVRIRMPGIGQIASNEGVNPGETSFTSLNLIPGTYEVECDGQRVGVRAEGDWGSEGPYENRYP